MINQSQRQVSFRRAERGNVLFLILIAVALFAALSYAVTQSTRSSGGNTSSETNLISSAQLTQYPAGVRTSVVRMLINGTAVEDLRFNDPSAFTNDPTDFDDQPEQIISVFHPRGGNATYQNAPKDVVSAGNANGVWVYNAEVQIQNIGLTDASTPDGNDVVAWLPDILPGVCKRMNEELGIGNVIPTLAIVSTVYETEMIYNGAPYSFPSGGGQPILSGGSNEFVGQPFGCFQNTSDANRYVYYHVLIER